MKFFQKTGVAVTITVIAVIAALVIGFLPTLQKSNTPEAVPEIVQSAQDSAQDSAQQTEQSGQSASTSQTAGDESIGNQYIRDEAGLLSKSTENKIKQYNDKIYSKTGTHIAILTVSDTGGMSLESYTGSRFDTMGLSESDMLFAVDTSTETWYVTTGANVSDYTDSSLESIFRNGFSGILDSDADDAAESLYKQLYGWCESNLTGQQTVVTAEPQIRKRKSLIGTIITLLVIYWILKAIFGSGRRGGGSGGGFLSGLFLGSMFSGRHRGPGPRPGPRPGGFGGGSRGGFGGGRGGFGGGRH